MLRFSFNAFFAASFALTAIVTDMVGAGKCTRKDAGYKQVNTLLSHAFNQIIADGQYQRIALYNAGFPGGSQPNLADPSTCLREWHNSEVPVGILADAIATGKFKWCIHPSDLGDPSIGLIGTAEADNFLQNVVTGEYYGLTIDVFNALTSRMSQILHKPLVPEFVVIPATDPGSYFFDFTNALASDLCYATPDYFFRHPGREAIADYTCSTLKASDAGFGLVALEGFDLSNAVDGKGEGISICTVTGSTQNALVTRTFPMATIVDIEVYNEVLVAFCAGQCEAVVDDLFEITNAFEGRSECAGLSLGEPVSIPSPSSGGDVGAITHRPLCD